MIPKGSIVVDELIVPIVDMYLDKGQFILVAELHGPVRAVDEADYTVHDRQGGLVVRVVGAGGLKWKALGVGGRLTVIVPLVFTDKMAFGVAA